MTKLGKIVPVACAAVLAFAAAEKAVAQDRTDCPITLGQESGDWQIYQTRSGCPKECGAVSAPVSTENRRDGRAVTVRRGDIRLSVTVVPASVDGPHLISFRGGYPFAQQSDVLASVDGTEFAFIIGQDSTTEEWAWPVPADDVRLVDAMKKGNRIVLEGLSQRGTTTLDTFSLRGFTRALELSQELCSQ